MPPLYNPKTVHEILETLTTLVEVMHLAHGIRDEEQFQTAHKHASELGFKLNQALNGHPELAEIRVISG